MADGGSGGHGGARSLFAYYGTLPSLPSSGSRCDEWNLVPWLVSPTLGGGHPFENNFTCAIERGRVARSSYVEWRIALGFCAPVPPNAIPVVLLLPDRAGRKWIWSSSSCSSGKCRRREREISIWTKALLCAHCGFATERKSGEGRGPPGNRYSVDGGILSSFETELCFFHFKSAVAVPDPCKKSRFEIYAGDYRSVDPRLWKKRFLH